ncbi:MAG: hypothetical protein ACI8SE_001986 [Bacteroidia bacterium]|jgi:hypothetical protein
MVKTQFEFIDKGDFYKLYQNIKDKSYWRLNCDGGSHRTRFLVSLKSIENWVEYDPRELAIELLKKNRGVTGQKCTWKDCYRNTLSDMAICAHHAYTEMGLIG